MWVLKWACEFMRNDIGFEVGAGFEEKGENRFGVELDAVMGGD